MPPSSRESAMLVTPRVRGAADGDRHAVACLVGGHDVERAVAVEVAERNLDRLLPDVEQRRRQKAHRVLAPQDRHLIRPRERHDEIGLSVAVDVARGRRRRAHAGPDVDAGEGGAEVEEDADLVVAVEDDADVVAFRPVEVRDRQADRIVHRDDARLLQPARRHRRVLPPDDLIERRPPDGDVGDAVLVDNADGDTVAADRRLSRRALVIDAVGEQRNVRRQHDREALVGGDDEIVERVAVEPADGDVTRRRLRDRERAIDPPSAGAEGEQRDPGAPAAHHRDRRVRRRQEAGDGDAGRLLGDGDADRLCERHAAATVAAAAVDLAAVAVDGAAVERRHRPA
jgi:hypothetical protein